MKSVNIQNLPLKDLGLPTLWWGNVALFSLPDAKLLMNYCANNRIAVLGVEGFRLEGNYRIPDMQTIADFSEMMAMSGASFPERSIMAMREFFKLMQQDGLFLEFVLVNLNSHEVL